MRADSASQPPLHESRAALAEAADKLRQKGDLNAALALYERLHHSYPRDALAQALLADALVACRQAGRALEVLAQAAGDSRPELETAKAKALLALGRWPEALELFRQVVDQYPSWADGWNNLACCLRDLGRNAEAAPRWRRALDLEPLHLAATLGLAKLYKELNSLEQSRSLLEAFLQAGDERQTRRELVAVLLRLGETATAVDHAQQLVKADGATLDDQMLLGRAHFLAGDVDAYIACLDGLPDQDWKGVSTESLAIGTLAEIGHIDQARQRLARHLEQDPGDANARRAAYTSATSTAPDCATTL